MYNQSGTDESTGFSLKNYRAPVLDNYTLGVNKDNDSYDKMGIWLSNEFVCDVSYERTVVDTKQKLKTIMLSSKSEGGSGIFKSNHKTVNTRDDIYNKLKKSRNVLVRKYRCTVYSAGIIYNNPRVNMDNFDNIVKNLVKECQGDFKVADCPTEKYVENMDDESCSGCISSWMRFFADYGTHVTRRISMGGIFRRFSNVSNRESKRDASKQKTTIKKSSSWFHLVKKKSKKTKSSSSKVSSEGKEHDLVQYTVGPEPHNESMAPDVFEDWVRDVALNPVPIDVEYQPLSEIMMENQAKNLYAKAIEYYTKLKGIDIKEKVSTETIESPISHLLKELTMVAVDGNPRVNQDICSGNSKIVVGFGVNLNEKKQILGLRTCHSGLNSCILDLNKDVKSTIVIALCGESPNYDIVQKVTKGTSILDRYNEVQCPNNMVVGFGAIIQFTNPFAIVSCPKGGSTCGYAHLGPHGLIWASCFPKNTRGLNLFDTKSRIIRSGKTLECDPGFKMANGFALRIIDKGIRVRIVTCPKFSTGCNGSPDSDTMSAAYIFCVR
ncbi:MAC/Perforin domain family protein [Babesia bovis T2Bo]|uniref:MAC/Perforin domain family protein n=1 Tax=Babesia bovis T2Bo TaxID=484906 RepID=UPI001C367458|nr:MAC/Perforin domain family protein [Babesia bovis T2Bo]KAG6440034.1 MAC/Perforin domain family protein [Babesia bovis T2Bo]